MNIQGLELEISSSKLNTNILLYRTVKDIIQASISNRQIIGLIDKIKLIIRSDGEFEDKKLALIESVQTLSTRDSVKNRITILVENSILDNIHFHVFKLSLNILRFKDYILEKSRLYTENFIADDNIHIMDFQYDQNMLNLPYSMRVSGALLIRALFSGVRDNAGGFYSSLISDIDRIDEVDPEIILQIIFQESASQSIRSSSGSDYESRFKDVLIGNNIKYQTQSFDKNLPSVEYDFKIELPNNRLIGVSAKRTLRERYKQNHENIDELEVDAMIVATLGIDLNEAKVGHILSKEKHYIFVASDLYDKIDFFNQNDKVYPAQSITNDLLTSLIV